MNPALSRECLRCFGVLLILGALTAHADVNSWTKPGSGNWEDSSSWSLGVPPDSSQSVMITNSGWKAVAINSSTAVNFPGSMSVSNLTILNPTNTENTLLMNYVGAGNPLVIGVDSNAPGSLIIGTNSTMAMFSSGLIVNNALGTTNSHLGEFAVNGTFTQSDGSEVVAGFLDLTGTYNLTNGMVFIGNQFINGTFNQQGGVNTGAITLQTTNGDYELFDGVVQGDESLYAGTFHQWAGTNIPNSLFLSQGGYLKNDGCLFAGDLTVFGSSGSILSLPGPGMTQFAGITTVTNNLIVEAQGNRHAPAMAAFNLYGGSLSANGILLEEGGFFTQTNGTVNVTNDLYITDNSTLASAYTLSGGDLSARNATVSSWWPENSSFTQSGGTFSVSQTLSIMGGTYAQTYGAVIAPHIVLTASSNPAKFSVTGGQPGSVLNSGTISMSGGKFEIGNSQQELGSLTIAGNSSINFADSYAFLSFDDSSTNTWNAGAQLTINNWRGSTNGGGPDQLIFGASSAALTASQLAQIIFVNPVGQPAGNYPARMLSNGEVVPDMSAYSAGPVNSWISGSGNWDDASSWSLGVLPDSTQTVMITNTGWKAVAINPSTPINYPTSMTVGTLTIRGSTNTENTLLLNYFGTTVPLVVSNGLMLQDDGQILDFNSGLVVQSGTFVITNSQMIQDGGFVRTTNAPMYLQNSIYQMTNGVFEGSSVSIGFPVSSHFNQYGGAVRIASLGFSSLSGTNENGYSLYDGTLDLPGGMWIVGGPGRTSYFQTGGTNRTSMINIERGYGGTDPKFTLNGGLLTDSGMSIIGGYIMSVSQNGGIHIITNALYLDGESSPTDPHSIYPATYFLNGGTLSAATIEVSANLGDAIFSQSNGVASAQTMYVHGDGYYAIHNTSITLAGGELSCSNLTVIDGGDHFNQSGGALVVSNSLNFSGSRRPGGDLYPPMYATYTFTGGTLTASNIDIGGVWIIGDSFTSRITNAGTFSLSQLLKINNAVEQLGRFILPDNATIDLAGEASKLSFANSSGEVWNSAAKLTVTNWNALTSGNYAGDALRFGTDQSGLTSAQLQQIHFINPTGFAPGDYAAHISGDGTVYPAGPAPGDSTNDWTGADGFWHDLTWSLGVRPDSTQTVRIIGGNRTVTVNATTATNYPESLTVHDLTVSGDAGTPSLVLSNAGTATPLRVLNGLSVKDGASLVNLNSGLSVDATEFTVTNAQVIQDGGFVRTTNATMRLIYGAYYMTNGVFQGGTVWAGTPYPALPGQFNQYGGSVRIADLALNNRYSLYGGTLDLPGGMGMTGRASGTSYFQSGGTNRTPFITMSDGDAGGGPSLTLNGGLLAVGNVDVHSGWYGESTVTQNGGTHSITNALGIFGGSGISATVRPAAYYLNGGSLSAHNIEMDANNGDAIFVQTNGTVTTETFFAQSVGYFGSFVIQMTLAGGSLSCSNFTLDDGHGTFTQSGGALIVSNLLTVTGYRDLNVRVYGRYNFNGGTVTASNINIAADWVIEDGTSNRISNPGFFSLSHTLAINNAVEQLGRFILATNATIDLSGSASRLSFANSSGETWTGGATLTILDWNGNASGGGGEQLNFGNNALGLTTAQLSQIRFVNPGGFPSGTYSAQILNTGEIVPTTVTSLTQERQGNNLVLNWPSGWTLQTATNVLGPYIDITTATSPYTNDMTASPQAFFRLRQ